MVILANSTKNRSNCFTMNEFNHRVPCHNYANKWCSFTTTPFIYYQDLISMSITFDLSEPNEICTWSKIGIFVFAPGFAATTFAGQTVKHCSLILITRVFWWPYNGLPGFGTSKRPTVPFGRRGSGHSSSRQNSRDPVVR